jgi:hypothetical protein
MVMLSAGKSSGLADCSGSSGTAGKGIAFKERREDLENRMKWRVSRVSFGSSPFGLFLASRSGAGIDYNPAVALPHEAAPWKP